MPRPILLLLALCLLLALPVVRADVAVPPNVLNPATPTEAWNVIRLATTNIETLLKEKRLDELAIQVSLCSPALRTLARTAASPTERTRLEEAATRAFRFINMTAEGGIAKDLAKAETGYAGLHGVLAEMAKVYDPKVLNAEIHFCPMHPEFVSVNAATPCDKCGMGLLQRRIPYSFIYVAPGEPSLKLTVTADAPLEVGRAAQVKVRIEQRNGKPVLLPDLLVMHTQPIHLLIVDASLGDYHHEHPTVTGTPGEYAFTFTPRNPGPYRMWADVVPAATGLQEYPVVDLPSKAAPMQLTGKGDIFECSAGGLNFKLSFADRPGVPPRAREIRLLKVEIADASGQPMKQLMPVMNAFAHLVGFHEDFKTVVHLHPTGGDILRDDVRGGPALGFKFYPPKSGFIRLYCQVLVDGKMIFAPFNVNIAE